MVNIVFIASFIILSIIGIMDSGYLVLQHYRKKPVVCPFNQNCSVVLESKWSRIFYVRNEFLGFLFYVMLLIGILSVILFPNFAEVLYLIFVLVVSIAFFFSLFLLFIQIFIIKSYCSYCIASAILNLFIFLNSIILFLS